METNKIKAILTSSLIIRLGLRPFPSSGGIRDPLLLEDPDPGTREPFLLSVGVFSRMTSILGASGALISGTLVA